MLKKLLAFCFVIMTFSVWAQKPLNSPELPQKVQGIPKMLMSNHLYRDDLEKTFHPGTNWGTDKTDKQYWEVCSDRDNNTTYSQPSRDAKICARLPLNGEFRIAEVKGDWALIYKEKDPTASFPFIKNKIVGFFFAFDTLKMGDKDYSLIYFTPFCKRCHFIHTIWGFEVVVTQHNNHRFSVAYCHFIFFNGGLDFDIDHIKTIKNIIGGQ